MQKGSGSDWRSCLKGWTSQDAYISDGLKAKEWYERADHKIEKMIAKYSAQPVLREPMKADTNFLTQEAATKIVMEKYGREEGVQKINDYYDIVLKPLNFEVLYFLSTKKIYCDLYPDEQRENLQYMLDDKDYKLLVVYNLSWADPDLRIRSLEDHRSAEIEFIDKIHEDGFNPWMFHVVMCRGAMESRIGCSQPSEGWISWWDKYVKTMANHVHKYWPDCLIGVEEHGTLNDLQPLLENPALDVISINYPFDSVLKEDFAPTVMEEIFKEIEDHGKMATFSEGGLTSPRPKERFFRRWPEDLEAKYLWFKYVFSRANSHNSYVFPYWTIRYVPGLEGKDLRINWDEYFKNMYAGEKTPMWCVLKNMDA